MENINSNINKVPEGFECNFCSRTFSYKCACKRHIVSLHMHKMLLCSQCNKSYKSLTGLRAHMVKSHSNSSLACPIPLCKKEGHEYSSIAKLQKHMAKKHEGRRVGKCNCLRDKKLSSDFCFQVKKDGKFICADPPEAVKPAPPSPPGPIPKTIRVVLKPSTREFKEYRWKDVGKDALSRESAISHSAQAMLGQKKSELKAPSDLQEKGKDREEVGNKSGFKEESSVMDMSWFIDLLLQNVVPCDKWESQSEKRGEKEGSRGRKKGKTSIKDMTKGVVTRKTGPSQNRKGKERESGKGKRETARQEGSSGKRQERPTGKRGVTDKKCKTDCFVLLQRCDEGKDKTRKTLGKQGLSGKGKKKAKGEVGVTDCFVLLQRCDQGKGKCVYKVGGKGRKKTLGKGKSVGKRKGTQKMTGRGKGKEKPVVVGEVSGSQSEFDCVVYGVSKMLGTAFEVHGENVETGELVSFVVPKVLWEDELSSCTASDREEILVNSVVKVGCDHTAPVAVAYKFIVLG